MKGRAPRADIVDGRFAFVGGVSLEVRQCERVTWLFFSPLLERHGRARRYERKSRWTMIKEVQCSVRI